MLLTHLTQTINKDSLTLAVNLSRLSTDKDYETIQSSENCSSYSKLSGLYECPRKYQLKQYEIAQEAIEKQKEKELDNEILHSDIEYSTSKSISILDVNLDFVFGTAVGAGIQAYLATKDMLAAKLATFISWKASYDDVKVTTTGRDTFKSLHYAILAVEKVESIVTNNLPTWDIFILPNGRPAVEVKFRIKFGDWYHFGHIDAILQNRNTKELAIWEGKTSGSNFIHDAQFSNSSQTMGYSVIASKLAKELGIYQPDLKCFYVLYNSKDREYTIMNFSRSLTKRLEWIQDTMLTHGLVNQYSKMNFFPQRGDACVNSYNRLCNFYGSCDMKVENVFRGIKLNRYSASDEVDTSIDVDTSIEELLKEV
jgi:hypothetical protein